MDFSAPPKRPRGESIVPMINVVFLLLIFFLMTSHLAQPEPIEVAPPESNPEVEPVGEVTLYVDAKGILAFEESRGDAAIAAVTAQVDGAEVPILLRADAQVKGTEIAKLLRQLSEAGLSKVELVVVPQ